MNRILQQVANQYWFRVSLTVICCLATICLGVHQSYVWFSVSACLLILSIIWQVRLYRLHIKQVLFMIDALENNDSAFRFPEESGTPESKQINRALNRVGHILYNVKAETAQQEKYYELILDFVSTGLLVLNDNGAVYQKNKEALRLLGLNVFTHVRQLSKVDATLMEKIESCCSGDKLQVVFHNERGTVNLSIRVSEINVHKEHLRILALNDINIELDEKEIDSWIRLTRVLTHEIMNSVTPITSLSDTLLSMVEDKDEEISHGLQTISATGKGLLAFVESYRKFTRIPTPEPSLFYLKAFIERMVELARHQNPCDHITFHTKIDPADLILHADENLISQVVINLLKNAIQAIGDQPDGQIDIQVYCNETEEVLIEIKNNGPVIPPEIVEHIFIPFFTSDHAAFGWKPHAVTGQQGNEIHIKIQITDQPMTPALTNNPLFRGITPEKLSANLEEISFHTRSYRKGEILARQGDVCNRLVILTKGSVRGEMIDYSGRLIKVEDIAAPRALAPLFLFGEENRFPVEVTANEPTEVIEIPKASVLELFRRNEQFLENYMNLSANYARTLSDKLFFMSFKTIRQKIASYLLRLYKQQQQLQITLDRSQQELSDYFGVSRPSLARELSHMQEDGMIIADRKQITILQKEWLIRLIQ